MLFGLKSNAQNRKTKVDRTACWHLSTRSFSSDDVCGSLARAGACAVYLVISNVNKKKQRQLKKRLWMKEYLKQIRPIMITISLLVISNVNKKKRQLKKDYG